MAEDRGVLDASLASSLQHLASESAPLVLPGSKAKSSKKEKRKNQRIAEEARTAALLLRPHNATPSRKRSQRGADEFFSEVRVNKKKRKALEKFEESKRKKERRRELIASLSQNQLSDAEQRLLTSTSKLGQKKTRKDQLRESVFHDRLSAAQREQFRQQEQGSSTIAEQDLDSTAKSRSGSKKKTVKKQRKSTQPIGARFTAVQREDSDSSSSSDEEPEKQETESKTISMHQQTKVVLEEKSTVMKDSAPAKRRSEHDQKAAVAGLRKIVHEQQVKGKERYIVRARRGATLDASRKELPVVMMEQEIMDTIENNAVTVLCGETGSGKTTQVPQFLFEAGYGDPNCPNPAHRGMVAVTQPRRVAAVSMARRVASELGTSGSFSPNKPGAEIKDTVGYQIRHDSRTINERTRVKFMTDGVLLREARDDLLLRKYSCIILDEAHERNLNTDILLGILSRVVPLRQEIFEQGESLDVFPLRVVIMSATLRVDDFARNPRLFETQSPPVVNVESRQFSVAAHFSRRTELRNYLEASFKKVCAIHKRLPSGGILVFLTGQREIEWMCKTLEQKFNSRARPTKPAAEIEESEGREQEREDKQDGSDTEYSDIDSSSEEEGGESDGDADENKDGSDNDNAGEDQSKAQAEKQKVVPLSANDRIKAASAHIKLDACDAGVERVHVLPLYSRLPTDQQLLVFKQVPKGHRLIVVATNVAETSVTIPGIKYVVDSGREKRKVHDQVSGISKFEIGWVSQASANQRMGRAGRTGPGHCYRLYSSALFADQFLPFPAPEIRKMPIEDLLLYMKTMGIEKIESFPFPSAPDLRAIQAAESRLLQLGALSLGRQRRQLEAYSSEVSTITPLGRRLAQFPVSARFAKMLAVACFDTSQGVERLKHVISLVAALSLQDPFLHQQILDEGRGSSATRQEPVKETAAANGGGGGGGDDDDDDNFNDIPDAPKESAEQVEERRVLREQAKQVAKAWKDTTSDGLSLLVASGAYAHTVAFQSNRKAGEFCRENFLHAKTMREQMQLREQLLRLAARLRLTAEASGDVDSEDEDDGEDSEDDIDPSGNWQRMKELPNLMRRLRGPMVPLQNDDRVYLRQVIASGLLDQVARKMTKDQALAWAATHGERGAKKLQRWPYVCCSAAIDEPVFIHPNSNLHNKNQTKLPDFVVYSHIDSVEKKRPQPQSSSARGEEDEEETMVVRYMRRVTAVQASWLYALSEGTPQCSLGAVLEQPQPTYDGARDELLGYVHPLFGPKLWKLPAQWLPFACPDHEAACARARWFGRALLEGQVVTALLETMGGELALPAAYMTRKVHDPRVESLTRALVSGPRAGKKKTRKNQNIFTREQLIQAWQSDRHYLVQELSHFCPKCERAAFPAKLGAMVQTL